MRRFNEVLKKTFPVEDARAIKTRELPLDREEEMTFVKSRSMKLKLFWQLFVDDKKINLFKRVLKIELHSQTLFSSSVKCILSLV